MTTRGIYEVEVQNSHTRERHWVKVEADNRDHAIQKLIDIGEGAISARPVELFVEDEGMRWPALVAYNIVKALMVAAVVVGALIALALLVRALKDA